MGFLLHKKKEKRTRSEETKRRAKTVVVKHVPLRPDDYSVKNLYRVQGTKINAKPHCRPRHVLVLVRVHGRQLTKDPVEKARVPRKVKKIEREEREDRIDVDLVREC